VVGMTAKRWEIIDEEFISYTGGTAQLISNGECKVHLWETPRDAQLFCDKLNELHEENQALKHRLAISKKANFVTALEEENKQLKSTMKEVAELLEEEVDLFSDKATEHDINAYVELKELDNKDAFYMATATKKAIKMLKELEE
jgi:hypothetical protein